MCLLIYGLLHVQDTGPVQGKIESIGMAERLSYPAGLHTQAQTRARDLELTANVQVCEYVHAPQHIATIVSTFSRVSSL